MRLTLLDATNWRWLPILAILASILSGLSLIFDKIEKNKIINALSLSIPTGLAFSVTFLLGALILDTLQYLNYFILGIWLGIYNPKTVLVSENSTALMPVIGLYLGFLLGGAYSLSYTSGKLLAWVRKYFIIIFLIMTAISTGITIISDSLQDPSTNSIHPLDLIALTFALVAGFLCGNMIDTLIPGQRRYQLALTWFMGIFFLLIISLLAYLFTQGKQDMLFQELAFTGETTIQGFLVGFLMSPTKIDRHRATWSSLFLWLGGSTAVGLVINYSLAYLHPGLYQSIGFVITLSTLIPAILLGRGNRIIAQKNPKISKGKGITDKDIYARVYWSKLCYGGLIGALYTFTFSFNHILYAYFFRNNSYDFGMVIYYLFDGVAYALYYGILIGMLHGFGPWIRFLFHDISDKTRLVIVVTFGILSAVLQGIPSIIDLFKP